MHFNEEEINWSLLLFAAWEERFAFYPYTTIQCHDPRMFWRWREHGNHHSDTWQCRWQDWKTIRDWNYSHYRSWLQSYWPSTLWWFAENHSFRKRQQWDKSIQYQVILTSLTFQPISCHHIFACLIELRSFVYRMSLFFTAVQAPLLWLFIRMPMEGI